MRKLTTKEFIEKAQKVHGDKYNYEKVKYVDAKTKVIITCPIHGDFSQQPYNHLNGNGCPKCVHNHWDTESFINEAKKIHGDKYDYSKTVYKSVRDKVCIICHDLDRHGNEIGEFWQYPLTHLNGSGCEREIRGKKEECWETRICPICGKEFKIRKKYEKITCSEECRKKYIEIHKDEINAKRSDSLKKTNALKSKEDFDKEHEKAKKTCLERYGVENFSQTKEARQFLSQKMKKQKREWDEKNFKEVLIPKYKQICEEDNLELLEFRNRFNCLVKCKKCGNIFEVKTFGYLTDVTTKNRCKICHPFEEITGPTNIEITFEDFLKEIGVRYYKNYRAMITPQEIDFYLPDYKVGFELDGLYWHCEQQKPNNYHNEKTLKCLEKGVRLIHIFEDEWKDKQEICKSRIKSILNLSENKIGARECEVKELTKKQYKKFVSENHIQGYTSSKICYGLVYNGEIVSIMSFGSLRKNLGQENVNDVYELIRFCNKLNTNVIGGASKLLKHFIDNYKPLKIISYADRRWSNGELYEKLGFTYKHSSKPNYFYLVNGERKNRFGFRKNVLVEKYNCPKEMSEHEFCLKQHWYRIYDCGTNKYELKNP